MLNQLDELFVRVFSLHNTELRTPPTFSKQMFPCSPSVASDSVLNKQYLRLVLLKLLAKLCK